MQISVIQLRYPVSGTSSCINLLQRSHFDLRAISRVVLSVCVHVNDALIQRWTVCLLS